MSRQERLALEAHFKHLERMMKLQNDSLTKQLKAATKINNQNKKAEKVIVRQENKSPWAWVAALFILLVIIVILKYGSRFK
jgi:high-affinity Fe2+/Pb2+ permease